MPRYPFTLVCNPGDVLERYLMGRKGWTTVDIERDDYEPVAYRVEFEICPAEPDVGFMMDYIEVHTIELDGISVDVTPEEFERITIAVEQYLWP